MKNITLITTLILIIGSSFTKLGLAAPSGVRFDLQVPFQMRQLPANMKSGDLVGTMECKVGRGAALNPVAASGRKDFNLPGGKQTAMITITVPVLVTGSPRPSDVTHYICSVMRFEVAPGKSLGQEYHIDLGHPQVRFTTKGRLPNWQ